MSFPSFSSISSYALQAMNSRKGDSFAVSKLNCFVKLISGAGCVLYSNPNIPLFSAAGDSNPATIYGNKNVSGIIGVDWGGKPIQCDTAGSPGRPNPIVTSLEIDEGAGELSRKAKFTIRCFSVQQLNMIMGYYMEPGFSVFIEWGWNVSKGVMNSVSAANIASYQSVANLEGYRQKAGGYSDVYLGFITGGTISVSETYWDVNVKCSGYTELPAYLMVADNARKAEKEKSEEQEVSDYPTSSATHALIPIQKRRWRQVFNALPSNKKTKLVKQLEASKRIADPINFINFDKKIAEDINTNKEGSFWGSIFGDDTVDVADPETGEAISVEVADGTKLIGDERFIRVEALIAIMNRIEAQGIKIGGSYLNFQINTNRTVCTAFDRIFSTDRTKLFIPNKNSPGPDFGEVAKSGTATTVKNVDNTVKWDGNTIAFPQDGAISGGEAKNSWGDTVKLFYSVAGAAPFSRKSRTWGFLNDLYVNFDFAKGILETKNFLRKDALYQLLNGISGAAGGIWDFQIIESPDTKQGIMELQVVEMNCVNQNTADAEPATFILSGPDSVFLEASFDMDIGGAMMNQIIGQKNQRALNSSSPPASGRLFTTKQDQIQISIIESQDSGKSKWGEDTEGNQTAGSGTEGASEEDKEVIAKKFAAFFEKVCLAPHVEIKPNDGKWEDKPYEKNYMCAYNDQAWFEAFKIGSEATSLNEPSILLPIKFTFTVHGVSGIKRGDKFVVKGLPQQYSEAGFFQVTGIKHTLSGMLWKTEVTGGFRQIR